MTSDIVLTFYWPKSEEWQYAAIKTNGELDFFRQEPSPNDLFVVPDEDEDDPNTVIPVVIKRPSQ
jgi:hypothetical protein